MRTYLIHPHEVRALAEVVFRKAGKFMKNQPVKLKAPLHEKMESDK
jgi:hypothetical protein